MRGCSTSNKELDAILLDNLLVNSVTKLGFIQPLLGEGLLKYGMDGGDPRVTKNLMPYCLMTLEKFHLLKPQLKLVGSENVSLCR